MTDVKDKLNVEDDYLTPLNEEECSPEHDAWMKAQTQKTLAKKQAGKMSFRSLDEVMRKFGFDAR